MPPPSPKLGSASPADLDVCRTLIQQGSRSFYAASLLLPQRVRDPAYALYAFCRLADDAVDTTDVDGGQNTRAAALSQLMSRLDRAYAGDPYDSPADRAFADVVAYYDIPRVVPAALLEGFAWDLAGRRYQTLSELNAYAARVAGTVGTMMTALMGVRRADVVARACDLGVAMQLTNIARDVGEDARAGRIYLPLDWLHEAGIDPDAWLRDPCFDGRVARVVRRLLAAADQLYQRAEAGIACLPRDCRPAIFAARFIYAEIGREIERQGLDSINQRAVVSKWRKMGQMGRAVAASAVPHGMDLTPALDETKFLVEALSPAADLGPPPVPWWNFGVRWGEVVEMFSRLEQRDRLARVAGRDGLELDLVSQTASAGEQ